MRWNFVTMAANSIFHHVNPAQRNSCETYQVHYPRNPISFHIILSWASTSPRPVLHFRVERITFRCWVYAALMTLEWELYYYFCRIFPTMPTPHHPEQIAQVLSDAHYCLITRSLSYRFKVVRFIFMFIFLESLMSSYSRLDTQMATSIDDHTIIQF